MRELLMPVGIWYIDILKIVATLDIIIISLTIVKIITASHNYIKNKLDLERYIVDIHLKVDEEDFKLLDYLINDIMMLYLIKEGVGTLDYINTDKETELCIGLVEEISKTISPAMMTRLSKIYNENVIADIITNKAYIELNNYVISHNRSKK